MRTWFRKLFRRANRPEEETDYTSLQKVEGGLQGEYEKLVLQQIRRWGIAPSCASVAVRQVGTRQNKEVFAAFVHLHGWDRNSALRLLLGLPRLDTKVREGVRAHWLGDVSHFDGIWLQTTDELHDSHALGQLRQLLESVSASEPDTA